MAIAVMLAAIHIVLYDPQDRVHVDRGDLPQSLDLARDVETDLVTILELLWGGSDWPDATAKSAWEDSPS